MKTSFENTAGLGHSSCLSMWSRVRRGEVSPAGGPGAAPGDPNCTGGGWGVPWKSWASAPNPAIGTSFGNCDMELHVVAAGDALNAAQHRCLERWAELHVGISGRSAQAVRGEPTVLVVSRARSTVGKGRQSRDAGEPVILAKRAPFHWGAWKTVWSLCLGVRGPLSRASSPQLPSILCGNCSHSPLLQPVPPVGTRACGRGSAGRLRDPWWEAWGAGRAPLLFCPLVGQDGCTGLASCPGSSPCEGRVGRMGAFWEGPGEGLQHTPPTPPSLLGARQGFPPCICSRV